MDFMELVQTEIQRRLNSYSNSHSHRPKTLTSIAIEDKLTAAEEDAIVDSYSDIIESNYRTWFIKRLKVIGKTAFIERAEKARQYGRNPQKLIVYLMK